MLEINKIHLSASAKWNKEHPDKIKEYKLKLRMKNPNYKQHPLIPKMYKNSKYGRIHRLLMEKEIGRKLGKNEVVHHKDKNKHNNSIDNLEVLTPREHFFKHPECSEKAYKKITKYYVDVEELKRIYKDQRKTSKETSIILNIPLYTVFMLVRKYKIKRDIILCECGNKAIYIKDKMCLKCYLRRYNRAKNHI